jgi:hypothetical protein
MRVHAWSEPECHGSGHLPCRSHASLNHSAIMYVKNKKSTESQNWARIARNGFRGLRSQLLHEMWLWVEVSYYLQIARQGLVWEIAWICSHSVRRNLVNVSFGIGAVLREASISGNDPSESPRSPSRIGYIPSWVFLTPNRAPAPY